MKKIPENKIKIKKLENFLNLSAKEIRKLNDKELVKGLRYFRTDLKYDLRKPLASRSKGKIRDIREIYISTMSVPNPSLYSPRSKAHKKAAQEYVGVGKNWKKLIINKERDENIYFKNGNLRIRSKYIDKGRGIFDAKELVRNPQKEINRVLKGETFDVSKLICGDAYIGGHASPKDYGDKDSKIVKDELLEDVNFLMNKYDAPLANNNWENWLFGVELINLKNQNKKGKKKFKSKIGKNINRNKRKLSNGNKAGSSRRL